MSHFKLNKIFDLQSLMVIHGRRQRIIMLCLAISFSLSAWLTTKGMFDKAIEAGVANMEGMITAAMSAAVAATALGCATILLMGVAAETFRSQRFAVALLAVTLIPFTAGISTYNAILGNAGPASLVYDMRDKAEEYSVYYHSVAADATGAQTAKSALEPLEASICALADGEDNGGAITGSGGKGAVYAAYLSGCTSIRKILETLSETVIRTSERQITASDILATLQDIPADTSLSVFERQTDFRAETAELQNLIKENSAENVANRLTAQLDILKASVATLDVKNGSFGQKQSGAIQSLKAALGLASDTIDNLTNSSAVMVLRAPGKLLEMGEAVAAHWKRNIPQILLAILIDGLALWFAGLLMLSRSIIEKGSS